MTLSNSHSTDVFATTSSRVWLEQLSVLHTNQLTTFIGSWIAGLLLYYLYADAMPASYLRAWLGMASVVAVSRVAWWFSQKPEHFVSTDTSAAARYVRGSIIGSYFSGLVWGISVIAISIWPVSDLLRLTLLFVLIGLGSSSIFALASVWHVYLGFFVVAYIPVVFAFSWIAWRTSSQWYAVIAALSLLYFIVNTRFAWRYHSTLLEALRLRFNNQALALKIEQERDYANSSKAAQENFIVAVSHDLRQPLQALTVFTTLLKNKTTKTPALLPIQELSDLIHQSTFVLSEQVEHLLDIHRAEQDSPPKMEATDLRPVLERIAREMRFIADQRDLVFKLKLPATAELDCMVMTDGLLLERVVRNLLDNAFKYTHRGGVVVRLRCNSDVACIEVIDTGRGMNTQLSQQAHAHPESFGFGLNIVRRICQRLGHEIHVSSRIGRGTRCTVEMKRLHLQHQIPRAQTTEPITMQSILGDYTDRRLWNDVWVFDDDPLALRALTILLEPHAKKIYSFKKKAEFQIVIGREKRPDCVVIDWQIGYGDQDEQTTLPTKRILHGQHTSAELIYQLREEYNFDVPICIVSANIPHARKELSTLKQIVFIKKPMSNQDLLSAFDQLKA